MSGGLPALAMSDAELASAVARASDVIERALALYGARELAFAFNGGKDSTVVLELLRTALSSGGGGEPAEGGGAGARAWQGVDWWQ